MIIRTTLAALLVLAVLGGSAAAAPPPVPPLQAEAASAAAGDIPDNQVFVTYRGAGYAIRVPEGWARSGRGAAVTFRDKNNVVRVVIQARHAARSSRTYRTQSAPNPVTGKRVTLVVARHTIPHGGKTAVIDLGGAAGVDNVDAYRLILQSFRWR